MKVNVHYGNGLKTEVELAASCSCLDIARAVETATGIGMEKQRLSYAGSCIFDGRESTLYKEAGRHDDDPSCRTLAYYNMGISLALGGLVGGVVWDGNMWLDRDMWLTDALKYDLKGFEKMRIRTGDV
jgi:hypothetical protein